MPVRFASIEKRREIWISLNTDSLREAKVKEGPTWEGIVAGWEAMLAGNSEDAEARYRAAKQIAKAHGFRFLPAERVAALPLNELVDRALASRGPDGKLDRVKASGILGTAKKPEIRLSQALDLYWTMADSKAQGKSPDQIRRWRNPRVKAFKNLINVVGDVPLQELTADDLFEFRNWWWDKITSERLTPNSGNKDFTHIASTIKLVNQIRQLNLKISLTGLAFSEGKKAIRKPFSEEWIRDKVLAPGALDGLNLEARCILLGMVNTGYRPSEGQGLKHQHIRLDVDHPHISIEPEGRTLKTSSSERIIPLAGISLEAFRRCPDGFPRYAGTSGLSATLNKFLRENGLAESDEHTLYGLRHSFEDRLLDRDVDERIRRDLMGHALARERYGKGASLAKLAGIVQSIAL